MAKKFRADVIGESKMQIFAEKFRQLSWSHIKLPASEVVVHPSNGITEHTMKTGQLALRILAISLCIWATNASSPTTTETTTTTTDSDTTTTTTAATTTTTTASSSSSSSSSKVHRKRFRIKNLKYSIKRRVRVYRDTSASSTSRNRTRNRSGRRVSVRSLNRLLRRRNQG